MLADHLAINAAAFISIYTITTIRELLRLHRQSQRPLNQRCLRRTCIKSTIAGCCAAAVGESLYGMGLYMIIDSGWVLRIP